MPDTVNLRCQCGFAYEGPVELAPVHCPQCGKALQSIDVHSQVAVSCDKCGWKGRIFGLDPEDGNLFCPRCGNGADKSGSRERIAQAQPSQQGQQSVCRTCGGPMTYIPQYQRWYCYNCKKYAQQSQQAQQPVCQTCGKPLTYIQQYQRWYCYDCKKYA